MSSSFNLKNTRSRGLFSESKGKFTSSRQTAVRAYSTSRELGSSKDYTGLAIFSDADKDKLDILKYIKGKSGIACRLFSTNGSSSGLADLSKDSANLVLNNLNPNFVSGFTDGEGSFIISITKAPEHKIGLRVKAIFRINLHKKDLDLLKLIQAFFEGAGNIGEDHKGICSYTVYSLDQICNIIIPHFDKFPLITQKLADYLLFRKIVMLIKNKDHLTEEGLKAIIDLKTSLNKGLSVELKALFPNSISVNRDLVENQVIADPHWLAGFISAEGSFFLNIYKAKTNLGVGVKLVFRITQHIRDDSLMRSIILYLGCGKVYPKTSKEAVDFMVTGFSDITNKVLPFLYKYPVLGNKSEDFKDFARIAELMKDKKHLTKDGLEEILKIKAGMNTGREL